MNNNYYYFTDLIKVKVKLTEDCNCISLVGLAFMFTSSLSGSSDPGYCSASFRMVSTTVEFACGIQGENAVLEIVADSPAAIFPSLSMSTLAESHTDMTNPIQHVYQNNNTLHRRTISQTTCFGETPTSVTNGETPANDRKSKTAIRLDSNNSSPK